MITLEQVRETARQVVSEYGADYVYTPTDCGFTSCKYVHFDENQNPTPGCLVGVILHRLGVSFDTLLQHEGEPAFSFRDQTTTSAMKYLQYLQRYQDAERPWGEALALTEEETSHGYA